MCLADESVLIYATASGYGYRVEVRNKAEQCSFSPLDVDHTECVWFQFFFLKEHLSVSVLWFRKLC